MSTLDHRIAELEAAQRPTLAAALGGTAVVTPLPDGQFRLHDGRSVTAAELSAIVKAAGGGRVLVMNL